MMGSFQHSLGTGSKFRCKVMCSVLIGLEMGISSFGDDYGTLEVTIFQICASLKIKSRCKDESICQRSQTQVFFRIRIHSVSLKIKLDVKNYSIHTLKRACTLIRTFLLKIQQGEKQEA